MKKASTRAPEPHGFVPEDLLPRIDEHARAAQPALVHMKIISYRAGDLRAARSTRPNAREQMMAEVRNQGCASPAASRPCRPADAKERPGSP